MEGSHNDDEWKKSDTKKYINIYTYIYINMCVCVCVYNYNDIVEHVKVIYGVRSQDSGDLWRGGR